MAAPVTIPPGRDDGQLGPGAEELDQAEEAVSGDDRVAVVPGGTVPAGLDPLGHEDLDAGGLGP